jgi:fatty acid-binding protein DegV
VLNIKPVLEMVDGELKLSGVDRSHEKSLRRMQRETSKHMPAEMLIVVHTRCSDEANAFARTEAERVGFPLEQMLINEAGPVLSCHAGPGVVAEVIVEQA